MLPCSEENIVELQGERIPGKHVSIFQECLNLWWEFCNLLLRQKEKHFVNTLWTSWDCHWREPVPYLLLLEILLAETKSDVLCMWVCILQSLILWAFSFSPGKKISFILEQIFECVLTIFFNLSTLFVDVIFFLNLQSDVHADKKYEFSNQTSTGVLRTIISRIGDRGLERNYKCQAVQEVFLPLYILFDMESFQSCIPQVGHKFCVSNNEWSYVEGSLIQMQLLSTFWQLGIDLGG